MTTPAIELGRVCPDPPSPEPDLETPAAAEPEPPARTLRVRRTTIDRIDPQTWDRLAGRSEWATPFSGWAFQRAWWDAYGANAHEETLIVEALEPTAEPTAEPIAEPIAIVPLMHRHEVEPDDELTHTRMRPDPRFPAVAIPPTAKAVFMGASYHADYATLLAAPADLPAVAEALAVHLAAGEPDPDHPTDWDVIDLRRFRCGDPAADELATAFRRRALGEGWAVAVEREDVCPVVTLPPDGGLDAYLASLTKAARHEIRRKVRRAERAGDVRLDTSTDPLADLDAFIELHQKRWGEAGLFPPTLGGDQSRVFIRRLFELVGPDGPVRLVFLSVGGRRIGSGILFETPDSILYYNAGLDPDAFALSPGVVMIERVIERALETGRRRLDFLRGSERYKYEWGATDEPIQRIVVRRNPG